MDVQWPDLSEVRLPQSGPSRCQLLILVNFFFRETVTSAHNTEQDMTRIRYVSCQQRQPSKQLMNIFISDNDDFRSAPGVSWRGELETGHCSRNLLPLAPLPSMLAAGSGC